MTEIGAGEIIYDLRKKIQQIKSDLDELGKPVSNIPELISSANLLRSNEYLIQSNALQSKLISAQNLYCKALEELLSSVFDIQHDLKEILKEQSSMLSNPKKRSKVKSKK